MTDFARMFLLDFDRMAGLFDYARSKEALRFMGHYPPVDIQSKDNNWVIQIALAGYKEKDLTVTTENNQLIVKGKVEDNNNANYIYKGISSKAFERRWQLDNDMEVVGVAFNDGMLSIGITKHIPETAKPKEYKLNSSLESVQKLLA